MPKKKTDFQPLLRLIEAEWNAAELAIKRAEQLGNETAYPSINELRYAGRKIVEVLALVNEAGDEDRINDKIRDLRMDIHRASHDALDSAVAIITLRIDIVRTKISAKTIRQVYPEYITMVSSLRAVHDKIKLAREDRLRRNEIYQDLEDNEYMVLHNQFLDFMASENILIEEAEQEEAAIKEGRRRSRADGILTGVISGLIVAGIVAAMAYFTQQPPTP